MSLNLDIPFWWWTTWLFLKTYFFECQNLDVFRNFFAFVFLLTKKNLFQRIFWLNCFLSTFYLAKNTYWGKGFWLFFVKFWRNFISGLIADLFKIFLTSGRIIFVGIITILLQNCSLLKSGLMLWLGLHEDICLWGLSWWFGWGFIPYSFQET